MNRLNWTPRAYWAGVDEIAGLARGEFLSRSTVRAAGKLKGRMFFSVTLIERQVRVKMDVFSRTWPDAFFYLVTRTSVRPAPLLSLVQGWVQWT